jgi:type IV secretion system protein VirB4
MTLTARLNQALLHLPLGWALQVENSRNSATGYPSRQQDVPWIAAVIDDERQAAFAEQDQHYISHYTWVLSYAIPHKRTEQVLRWLWEYLPEESETDARVLAYFEEEVQRWERRLKDLCPEVFRLQDEALLTYCHYTATCKTHPVATPALPVYLDSLLASVDLSPGIRPKLGDQWVRCLSIRSLPAETYPAILAQLDTIHYPFRWSQRWIPLDRSASIRECKKFARIYTSQTHTLWTMIRQECFNMPATQVNEHALTHAAEASGTQALVASGQVALGYYTGAMVLWNIDSECVKGRLDEMQHLFESAGAIVHIEDLNSVEAWLGTLPGHRYANIRRPLVHSMNLTHLLPLHAIWSGPKRCDHLDGPPLMLCTTEEGTPFHLGFHHGDVADALIIGPKGSGKSTLLRMIMLQWLARYANAQAYTFTIGGDDRIATLATGGAWYHLGAEEGLALQPLARIDQTDERLWAMEWLDILFGNERVILSPERKTEVWRALCTLATHESSFRTLTSLAALVQDREIQEALHHYTVSGSFGGILDADRDMLQQQRVQSFELQSLQDRPHILAPALFALFRRIEQGLAGAPTIILLDEAWLYLDTPVFVERIRRWLKTLRKKNASVIFSTQNLADIAQSPLASTISQECLTRVYLANPRALEQGIAETYAHFQLSRRQIELLSMMTPKHDYYTTSPLGSRLFQLELGPVAMAIAGAGSLEDLAQFEETIQREPEHVAQAWLKARLGSQAEAA